MQYTLEKVSPELDHAVRARAQAEGKSVDQFLIEHLERTLGVGARPQMKRDLSGIAGTWVDDPEFDKVMEEFEQIEPDMWK